MKESKTIKTIAIAVVSILIIAIIGLGIYTMFIKKDDNDKLSNVEIFEVYEFIGNTQDRTDIFFVTTDGEVYLSSTYEDFDGYKETDVKKYNIKNIGSYKDNKNFSGIKLNLNNIIKVYNPEYGNGGLRYFAFLTSDNRLYFTKDNSLKFFTSDELVDIVNVTEEEKCRKIDDFGNECATLSDKCYKTCAMWAYAINSNGNKIDLYDIETKLSK